MKYFSRKFIAFQEIIVCSMAIPLTFKWAGISETVTLASLGIVGAIAGVYHFANVKAADVEVARDLNASP